MLNPCCWQLANPPKKHTSPSQEVDTADDDEEDCPVELVAEERLEACELAAELVEDVVLEREEDDEELTQELTGETITCSSNGAHAAPGERMSSKMFGALQFHAPKW